MVQSNSVADAVEATYHIPTMVTGIILMVSTAAVILGGIKKVVTKHIRIILYWLSEYAVCPLPEK